MFKALPLHLFFGRLPAVLALAAAAASLAVLGAASQAGLTASRPQSLPAWSALFVAEWLLMTTAMMLPSSIPFLNAVHRVGGSRAGWAAAAAYLAAWGVLGAVLCAALWLAGDILSRLAPGAAATFAGATLLAAAAYQLTPFARECQRACAHPFAILARHWHQAGRASGAWISGLHYALSCMGCCVAMIAVMVVIGIHDLLWMLLFAALMVVQKHTAWGQPSSLAIAGAIGAAGLAIITGWWTPALHGLRALCA